MLRSCMLMFRVILCLWPVTRSSSLNLMGMGESSVFHSTRNDRVASRYESLPPKVTSSQLQTQQLARLRSTPKGFLWASAPRGGGKGEVVTTEENEFRFSDDQRAVFARMRRTMTLLGTLGIFVSSVQFIIDIKKTLQQRPVLDASTIHMIFLSSPQRLIHVLFSIILPAAADISLARLQLLLSRVFVEIESPNSRRVVKGEHDENDISLLMKAMNIYEGYLRKKRVPVIMKALATVVLLLTAAFKLTHKVLSHSSP